MQKPFSAQMVDRIRQDIENGAAIETTDGLKRWEPGTVRVVEARFLQDSGLVMIVLEAVGNRQRRTYYLE